MTLFHNLGIRDPERSARPNSKDACLLLLVNTWGHTTWASFLLTPCIFDWAQSNWPEKPFWLHPLRFNWANEITSASKKWQALGNVSEWHMWYCMLVPHNVNSHNFQEADQIIQWILSFHWASGAADLKSAVWARWEKKHKSVLFVQALWHQPQKPQQRQLSISPWTFSRNP